MSGDITPAGVALAFWRWFWVGLGTLTLLAALIVGGWQAGWWFTNQNVNREAHAIRNGYSNQQTLRDQITAKIADVYTLTSEIAGAQDNPQFAVALKAQRKAVVQIVCGDAAQVTGDPLAHDQHVFVQANCSAGAVSTSSPYFNIQGGNTP